MRNHKSDCGCIICKSGRAAKVKARTKRHRADTLKSWHDSVEIAKNILTVSLYAGPTILIVAAVVKGLFFILSLWGFPASLQNERDTMIDSIQVQKQVVKRKLQRTIKRLQDRMDTYKASIYYCRTDPSGYWEAVDELRQRIQVQRSALKRINRL